MMKYSYDEIMKNVKLEDVELQEQAQLIDSVPTEWPQYHAVGVIKGTDIVVDVLWNTKDEHVTTKNDGAYLLHELDNYSDVCDWNNPISITDTGDYPRYTLFEVHEEWNMDKVAEDCVWYDKIMIPESPNWAMPTLIRQYASMCESKRYDYYEATEEHSMHTSLKHAMETLKQLHPCYETACGEYYMVSYELYDNEDAIVIERKSEIPASEDHQIKLYYNELIDQVLFRVDDDEETTVHEVAKEFIDEWPLEEELPIYQGTEAYDELLQDIQWKADRDYGYTFKQED